LRKHKHAEEVEPAIKEANLKRLRRIEGQVQEALRGVGRQLLRNHLKHCATTAIKKGPTEADRTYDELLELITSISR
jgi:DNA-binding FrmR family transcriptional regulator